MNRLYAGDTLEFGVNVPSYLPADGWTLKMRYAPRFTTPAQAPIDVTATPGPVTIGGVSYDYAIQVTPTATSAWQAGAYGWHSWVEKAGARVTLEGTQFQGELTVLADPAALAAGADTRSQARKVVDDLRAWMAALAVDGASSGTAVIERRIGDRMVKFASADEAWTGIQKMLNYWERRLEAEIAREQGRASGPLGRMSFGVPN